MRLTRTEKHNFWRYGLLGLWIRRRRRDRWLERTMSEDARQAQLVGVALHYKRAAQQSGVDMSNAEAMDMAYKYSKFRDAQYVPTLEVYQVVHKMGRVRDI